MFLWRVDLGSFHEFTCQDTALYGKRLEVILLESEPFGVQISGPPLKKCLLTLTPPRALLIVLGSASHKPISLMW